MPIELSISIHNLYMHISSRTRDKEKYRLRRQHKRNDIIAFRKMQQLRREFSKATALVQLVLEREMLREVG